MKFKPSLLAMAVTSALAALHTHAVIAQENEQVLSPVRSVADRENDVQARTELGTLTKATPIAGAVLKKEELEELQLVNNLLELGKRVPGISMVRNMRIPDGGKNYTENRIDGLRVSRTSNSSLLDEVSPSNIERLEVITGPGSALYGSGAIGGTLSVFSRQPPKSFEAKVSQEVGSWDFLRTQGYIGTSSEDGRWGFMLNGSMMENGGWRKYATGTAGNAAAEKKDGQALKVMFRPTDSTKITLGADRVHYDFRLAGAIPLDAAEAAKLKNASINGVSLRSVYWAKDWRYVIPGTYGQSINDYETYTANLQQAIGERGEFSVAFGQRTNNGLGYGAGGSGGQNNIICDNVTVTCATYNANGTVTNNLNKSHEVVSSMRPMYRHEFDFAKTTVYAGTEIVDITTDSKTYRNSYNASQGQSGMWGVGALSSAGSLTTEKHNTPFYNVEFSPIEKLRFHVGQRFDNITYAADDRTAANRDTNKTYSADVWKTGLTYDLNKDHLVWAGWAQTFNAPAASTLLPTGTFGTAGYTPASNLEPEKGETRQIGFRGYFPEWSLAYDITGYHSQNKGFNVARDCTDAEKTQFNNGAACTLNENAGSLAAKGIESMFRWDANRWLDFGMTYTSAQAYYESYKTKTADYSGNSYQAMPWKRVNFRVGVKPLAGLRVELEMDYMSSYFYNVANTGSGERPNLFNLRANYKANKNWTFWVHAINLTDQKYYTRLSGGTATTPTTTSAGQGNAGSYAPLTLRTGIAYTF